MSSYHIVVSGMKYWRVYSSIPNDGIDLLAEVAGRGPLRVAMIRCGTSGTLSARGTSHQESDTPDAIVMAAAERLDLELTRIEHATSGCVPIFIGWA